MMASLNGQKSSDEFRRVLGMAISNVINQVLFGRRLDYEDEILESLRNFDPVFMAMVKASAIPFYKVCGNNYWCAISLSVVSAGSHTCSFAFTLIIIVTSVFTIKPGNHVTLVNCVRSAKHVAIANHATIACQLCRTVSHLTPVNNVSPVIHVTPGNHVIPVNHDILVNHATTANHATIACQTC